MTVLHTNASVILRVDDPDTQQRWVFPIISVSTTWAINEIPICNLEIGIGRAVNRGADEQATESASLVLTPRRVCRVMASFRGDFATDKPWPEDITTVFRGNCVGVSSGLTRGRATLNVTLHHWLQHLQFSTVLGGYAIPGDPESHKILAAAFGYNNSGEEDIAGSPPLATIEQLAQGRRLFNDLFFTDLWGVGIKPLIAGLIAEPITGRDVTTCEDVINQPAAEAIAAWKLLEGPAELGEAYSRWAVPLSLTGIGDNSVRLSSPVLQSIADSIAHAPIDYARQTDIWSQLVMRYCADFGAMLVPRVETAIVAPRVDALRSHYCYEIDANSIYQIDAFEPRQLPLAYIGVVADYDSPSGSDSIFDPLGGNTPTYGNNFVACYPSEIPPADPTRLRSTSGLTQFIMRPVWLAGAAAASASPLADFETKSVRGGVGATGQAGEQNNTRDTESRRLAAEATGQVAELLRRYAKMRYNQATLRGRGAKIIGKLRYDIAPGSTVAINVKPSDIRGLQIDAPRLFGLVSRITIVIDTQQKLASTVFQLSNLRTEAENNSEDYTSSNHPLYSSVFHGAPLLDDYALGHEIDGNECPS